ncbi:MAG TPA: hypothetical protein VHO66_01105 [Ruminiclostridium sp.]|nr:hypothetical protein [Ruminiclostridium sp.]
MNFNFSIREKIFLLVVGFAAVVGLGARFVIMPAGAKLSSDTVTFVISQTDVQKIKLDAVDSKTVAKSITKSYSEAQKATSPLFPSFSKASFNVWLAGIAKDSGLTVNTTTINDPVAATPGASTPTASNDKSSNNNNNKDTDAVSNDVEYNLKTFADVISGKSSVLPTSSTAPKSASNSKSNSSKTTIDTSKDAVLISISMNMTGSYDNVKTFLDKIKTTERLITVSSFKCSTKDNKFTFEVTLNCYAGQKLIGDDDILNWTLPDPSGKSNLM